MTRTSITTCPTRRMPPVVDRIVHGDNCTVLGWFPDGCIDLVVTSPPYDDLRGYGGHTWDFYGLAWQLKRVLKPGGVCVWVVADATVDGGETGSSMRQALHFQELGLTLHDTMIYEKSGSAFPAQGRYHQWWEYMFAFAKGKPKTFNPIKDRKNAFHDQRTHDRHRTRDGWQVINGINRMGEWGMRSNVWRYVVGGGNVSQEACAHEHPAIFPEGLAGDHIQSWSNEGDLVLDPFCGSGTTTKMACVLKRHFIGIDSNREYCELAVKRMGEKGFFA